MICFSGFFLFLKLIILIVLIIVWRQKAQLLYLFEDIKKKWLFYFLYFAHHILFRIMVAVVLLISLKIAKLILIIVLIGIQSLSLFASIIPVYTKNLLYF